MKVVVTNDAVPFAVELQDVIRITGKGTPQSEISIEIIKGPVKVIEINEIEKRVEGKLFSGPKITEFTLKPTGAGKVEAVVTVSLPLSEIQPEKTTYKFEIR